MRVNEDSKAERKKKTVTRIIKWVLAVVVVLIVLVIFLVPAFVSSVKGRQIILAKINDSIDGKADFAELSMSWWKGIKIADFSFNNNAGRTSVEVKQILTKPHYGSLLAGNLSFGETEIFEPRVEINLMEETPQKTAGTRQEVQDNKQAQVVSLPIKKIDLTVSDGNLKVTDSKTETVEFSQINSRLSLRPPGKETNFDVAMIVGNKGKEAKVHAEGQIVPEQRTGWSLKGTSGHFTVEVNDLDLASLGPIFELAGLDIQAEGLISADISSKIQDGRIENLSGTIKGRDLDITGGQLKDDRLKTDVLDVSIKLHSEEELINIDRLEIHSDWADAKASGTVPTTFKTLADFVKPDSIYNLKGSFECDLAEVLSQMPRTFGLKEQMEVTSGQLSGRIEASTKAGKKEIYGSGNLVGLAGVVSGKKVAQSEPVTAEVKITSDEAGIKFDKLDVSASFARINCTGSSELLKYEAEANLAKLQSELAQFIDTGQYKIAGELFSRGEVSGNKNKITAVGSSLVKELRLSSIEGVSAFEPKADIDFSIAIEPNKSTLDVNFIKARASLGEVSIKDAVLPLSEKATEALKLAISANNVSLEKLQPFAVLFASLPQKTQLAGIADSNLLITSENDSYQIVTDSTKIKNFKLISPGKKAFEQEEVSLIAEVEVNPVEKTFAVKKLQLTSPQIKIRKGNFSRVNRSGKTSLKGQVECEYDWSAVSAVATPYLPKGLELEGERKDTINFSSEYPADQHDKLLANLNTKSKLGFDKARYMGLNFGPTEVDIQVQNGLLKIAPFSSTVNNGEFSFAGQADFKKKPTLLKTPRPIQIAKDIQINDETTRRLLMYLNPIFVNAFNVSGVANFDCEKLAIPLAGAGKNEIEVIGTISISQLRLKASDLLSQILSLLGTKTRDQVITIRPTRFVLQNGLLQYEDMQMDIGDNPVNFKGIVGLDKSLNMTVTLPYTLKGRTARVGQETVGERISLALKGTIDKPELDLGKLLEQQLRQRLEDELRKGLEGLFK